MPSKKPIQTKALKWIQERLQLIESTLSADKKVGIITSKEKCRVERDALNTAKSAVQRQLATPAIQPEKSTDVLACPRCGHYLDGKPFFCGHCGQHIKYGRSELTEFDIFEETLPITAILSCKDGNDILTITSEHGASISINMGTLANVVTEGNTIEESCVCTVRYKNYH